MDQFDIKKVFNSLDGNRSGRINVRELVTALREMEVFISDVQAQDIIADLNARVGDTRSAHLNFRSFSHAFNRGSNQGTVGDVSTVPRTATKATSTCIVNPPFTVVLNYDLFSQDTSKIALEGHTQEDYSSNIEKRPTSAESSASSLTFTQVWGPVHAGSSGVAGSPRKRKDARPVSTGQQRLVVSDSDREAAARAAEGSPLGSGELLDTVQRMTAVPPNLAVLRKGVDRAKTYEQDVERAMGPQPRYDMMASWRGLEGTIAFSGAAEVVSTGRSIDWLDWQSSTLNSRAVIQTKRKTFAQEMTEKQALSTALPKPSQPLPVPPPHEPIAPLGTVASCMYPPPGTPAHQADSVRLSPRPEFWIAQQPKKERERARLEALSQRMAQRREETLDLHAREIALDNKLLLSRGRAAQIHQDRIADWQRVIESRSQEGGVEQVTLERSSFPGEVDAPPQLTSHWHTIQGANLDPPPREQVKMIVSP